MDELTYEEACKMSVEDLLDHYVFVCKCIEQLDDWNGYIKESWSEKVKEEHDALVKEKLLILKVIEERCGEE